MCISVSASAQIRIAYGDGTYDTLKGNIKQMTEYQHSGDSYVKAVYTFDRGKMTQVANFYDADKNDKWMGKWVVQYDNGGRALNIDLYCTNAVPCQGTTSKYDALGRMVENSSVFNFKGDSCSCTRLIDWISGGISEWFVGVDSSITTYIYKYNSKGRILEKSSEELEIEGKVVLKTSERISFKYDDDGNEIEIIKKRISTSPEHIDTTTEIAEYEYDKRSNKIEENVLTRDRKTQCVKTVFKYNIDNDLIESRTYYDPVRPTRPSNSGTCIGTGVEYTYDSLHHRKSHRYFQIYIQDDGEETRDVSNFKAEEKNEEDQKEYDRHGNIVKITSGNIQTLKREIEYY
jgi:membrane peptidoglycan carboxypeptidase